MKSIVFVSHWAKDRKMTWSGTTYNLLKHIKNKFDVVDADITPSRWDKLLWSIEDFFCKPSLIKKSISRYSRIFRKRHSKYLENREYAVFQFAEVVKESSKSKTYIYIDNSVSYLLYAKKYLNNLSPYLSVDKLALEELNERCASQLSYFMCCSGVFTMGQWLRKDLIDRCGVPKDKVFSVGGGINIDLNRIIPKQKHNNKVVFVGRDFKRKGGFVTYDAFKQLKSSIPSLELYVAGPEEDPIDNPIEGYYYMGPCSGEQIADLFNSCDLFCMPSYFEAYGLVFIEALSFGLPCIGRNCYEMPYFIEEGVTGELITDDDINVLASKIQKILEDDSYAKNVARKRDWYLEEYSWDMVAKRILNVIKSA